MAISHAWRPGCTPVVSVSTNARATTSGRRQSVDGILQDGLEHLHALGAVGVDAVLAGAVVGVEVDAAELGLARLDGVAVVLAQLDGLRLRLLPALVAEAATRGLNLGGLAERLLH